MAYIHQGSTPVISPENQLFALPSTFTESYETHDVELGPTTSVTDSNYIEFEIPASESEFLMLADTRFRCTFTLRKYNAARQLIAIEDTDGISVCNNLISSLWRSVDVSIEDKIVTNPSNMYGYRAYIENILGCSDRHANAVLDNGLWEKDTGNNFSDFAENTALNIRKNFLKTPFEIAGPLHVSLFQQSRPLVSGVKMRVRFIPQPPSFYIIKGPDSINTEVKATISKPRLTVRKMVPSISYKLAVEKLLLSTSAKYPIERIQMRSFTLPAGTTSITLENVVSGQLPKHIVLGLVTQTAFSGTAHENPYEFQPLNLNYLAIEVDGRQVPSKALMPDFPNKKYLDAYEQLVDSLGRLHNPDSYMAFDRHSYGEGFALFGFDLTPTKSGLGTMSLVKRGTLRVVFGFAAPLPSTTSVVMRLAYDNVIEITRDRLVNYDFVL